MKINFTGVNYVSLQKKQYSEYGPYISENKKIKNGNKDFTEIKLSAELVDDEFGNDFSDFKNRMNLCRPCYKVNCIDKNKPNKIDFYIKRYADCSGRYKTSNRAGYETA